MARVGEAGNKNREGYQMVPTSIACLLFFALFYWIKRCTPASRGSQ